MRVPALKPGHDGGLAFVDDGKLVFSLESEMDSNTRSSGLTTTVFGDRPCLLPTPLALFLGTRGMLTAATNYALFYTQGTADPTPVSMQDLNPPAGPVASHCPTLPML